MRITLAQVAAHVWVWTSDTLDGIGRWLAPDIWDDIVDDTVEQWEVRQRERRGTSEDSA